MVVHMSSYLLCYVVMCRWRLCDGPIARPKSPTNLSFKTHSFKSVLNGNRPESLIRVRKKTKMQVNDIYRFKAKTSYVIIARHFT